ncbi:S-layer homology domain-containing protein [Paenibacillus validus]|uniref:S-layer homology domain-containing protein n=1 Tax=Paenibacillus validus TaxID=44253 RepID=UPI003D26D19C
MRKKGIISLSIVAVLGLYVGIEKSRASFSDTAGHWGADAINKAIQLKVVDGYPDGSFKPEQSVSRAEFMKMTATALKLKLDSVEQGSGWYKAYVKALTDAGITRDRDFATEDWNAPITRLEMSRIAVRATDADLQKKEFNIDNASVMFNATKTGLIQGLANGELAVDGVTTRAQSVTIIDRMLKKNAGETLPVDKYAASNAEIALRGTNFETMYGKKSALTLPVQHTLVGDVKMTIKEVLFYDSSDQASPVWSLLEKGLRVDEKGLENSYYFVYKVEYDMGDQPRGYAILVEDYFRKTGWTTVYSAATADRIMRTEVGKKEGYMIFALSKDMSDPDTQYNALKYGSYKVNNEYFDMFVQ